MFNDIILDVSTVSDLYCKIYNAHLIYINTVLH